MVKKWTKRILLVVLLFLLRTQSIYAGALQNNKIEEEIQNIYLEKIKVLSGMTSQIQILGLEYTKETLIIDFDESIFSYGGGNYTERMIAAMMMEMVFTYTSYESMGITVNGQNVLFPEGNDFSYFTKEMYLTIYKLSEDYDEDYRICNQEPRESKRD
jgi:hypothetical protein